MRLPTAQWRLLRTLLLSQLLPRRSESAPLTPSQLACIRQATQHSSELQRSSIIPPTHFHADTLVAACVGGGYASWNLASSVLVCLPRICTKRFIASGLLPKVHPKKLPWSEDPLRIVNESQIVRMRPLRSLKLDFIIAGFPHSGTTSLHSALRRHFDIDMWPVEIHELFWQACFAASDLEPFDAMDKRKVKGIRSTWAATTIAVMRALATLPSLRVIVVARDPVSHLDSILSHGTTAFFNPFSQEVGLGLMNTATMFVHNLQSHFFSPSSKSNHRVLLVPSAQLSEQPTGTLLAVLSFLGVSSGRFSAGQTERHHVRPPRFPVKSHQSLCDVPTDWRPQALRKVGLPSLAFLDLLYAAYARERQRLESLFDLFGWPHPRLESVTCLGPRTCPNTRSDKLGHAGFCAVARILVSRNELRSDCPLGDACARCCIIQQGGCPLDRVCCAPVLDLLQKAAAASVREAFCGNVPGGGHGCSTRFLSAP